MAVKVMTHNDDITLADVIMAQAVRAQIEILGENYESLDGSPVERLRQFLTESLEAPYELLELARLTLADRSNEQDQHGLDPKLLEALFVVVLAAAADPDANVEELRNLFLEFIGETLSKLGSVPNEADLRGNLER
jgi:hypothetical protein